MGAPAGRGGLGPPCGAIPGIGAAPSGGTLATLVGATDDITGGVAEMGPKHDFSFPCISLSAEICRGHKNEIRCTHARTNYHNHNTLS